MVGLAGLANLVHRPAGAGLEAGSELGGDRPKPGAALSGPGSAVKRGCSGRGRFRKDGEQRLCLFGGVTAEAGEVTAVSLSDQALGVQT